MTDSSSGPATPAQILQQAIAWKEGGAEVALATVVAAWPTAPLRAGSQMAVRRDGSCIGSVFGPAVDAEVVRVALGVLAGGAARMLALAIDDATATGAGLACGGPIEIRLEPVADEAATGGKLALLRETAASVAARRSVVLCTALADGRRRLVAADARPVEGDGWQAEALRRARNDDSGIAAIGADQVLFQVFNAPLRLFIVGAARAARALLDAARLVGFAVTVIDPRAERMADMSFPGAHTVLADAGAALAEAALDSRSAVVFLSHAPEVDDPGLRVALPSAAFYVGALGSKRTHAARLERLVGQGIAPELGKRIHGPAGLAIGAIGPAEIAASIVAEMIAVLRHGSAAGLRP